MAVKLIRLTPSRTDPNEFIPVVSEATITALQVYEIQGEHVETLVYTAHRGVMHRVRETPEQIMELFNAE